MNEQEINRKIAKWLGIKIKEWLGIDIIRIDGRSIALDFLHDRNQQKWIKDKLKELGYTWISSFNGKFYFFDIMKKYKITDPVVMARGKSEDLALIQAVEQLINKEEK